MNSLAICLSILTLIASNVFAATSSATLEAGESSVMGGYIGQGSGNGTLSVNLTSGYEIESKAKYVRRWAPDGTLASITDTTLTGTRSKSVSLPWAYDDPIWPFKPQIQSYYVVISKVNLDSGGTGSLSN